MPLKNQIKKSLIAIALLLPFLLSTESLAGSASLTLKQTNLTNVTDPAGTWQHEAGQVLNGSTLVGYYIAYRRVTTGGTTVLNTATETLTVFLDTAHVTNSAPRNITIEGAHDFTSGNFQGSVSAASSQYSWIKGANAIVNYGTTTATAKTGDLTINWLEADTLTLP